MDLEKEGYNVQLEKSITSATNPSVIRELLQKPSGFLFNRDGLIYRQVNTIYKENYDHLINSGLYKAIVDADLLIPYDEVEL